jgi:hypothetical protein
MNRLSLLLGLAGLRLLFFAPSREPLLLIAIMRAGFFFVLLTFVAVEEEDFLRVAGRHTGSFRSWPRAVKGTTLPPHGVAMVNLIVPALWILFDVLICLRTGYMSAPWSRTEWWA